jgi:hypothetical protein
MRRLAADPDRIDWFAVLLMLQRAGLPASSVADQLRIPKSTILGWKQGAEPKYADGEALVGLWMRVLGNDRDALPRLGTPA